MNPSTIDQPSAPAAAAPAFRACADVHETPTHLLLLCNLPGVAAADVQLGIEGRVLTVSGTPQAGPPPEGKTLTEYPTGTWKRSFKLHCEVDQDHIQARSRNGVLEVTLPKASPAGPRRIPVIAGPETDGPP